MASISLSERIRMVRGEQKTVAKPTPPQDLETFENPTRTFDGEVVTDDIPATDELEPITLMRLWSEMKKINKKLDEMSKRQKRMQTAFTKAYKGKK